MTNAVARTVINLAAALLSGIAFVEQTAKTEDT
jgi:hypothetical protein